MTGGSEAADGFRPFYHLHHRRRLSAWWERPRLRRRSARPQVPLLRMPQPWTQAQCPEGSWV